MSDAFHHCASHTNTVDGWLETRTQTGLLREIRTVTHVAIQLTCLAATLWRLAAFDSSGLYLGFLYRSAAFFAPATYRTLRCREQEREDGRNAIVALLVMLWQGAGIKCTKLRRNRKGARQSKAFNYSENGSLCLTGRQRAISRQKKKRRNPDFNIPVRPLSLFFPIFYSRSS